MEDQKDLFEYYEELPEQIRQIIDRYQYGDNDYQLCRSLVTELEKNGYTCEYGLSGEPYNLRELTNKRLDKNRANTERNKQTN